MKNYSDKFKRVFCPLDYHPEWVKSRALFILNYLYKKLGAQYTGEAGQFLKGKTVLELGAHRGGLGANLSQYGASVTAAEGREDNCRLGKLYHPQAQWCQADLDVEEWIFDDHYDIIIHQGLLYHLQNPDFFLVESQKRCSTFFLETQVIDSSLEAVHLSTPPSVFTPKGELSHDSGLNAEARISVKYIEDRLKNFVRHDIPKLNGGGHFYDWPEKNDNTYQPAAHRRFWTCDL